MATISPEVWCTSAGTHGVARMAPLTCLPTIARPLAMAAPQARATVSGNDLATPNSARRLRKPSAALSITTMVTVSTMKEVVAEAPSGGTNSAKGVLVEAGWMDKLGRWTEKAASHGVKNDVDFLDRPEAQEQAMSDVLRVYDNQTPALGLARYVGQTIKDTAGSPFRVSRAGIIALGIAQAQPL